MSTILPSDVGLDIFRVDDTHIEFIPWISATERAVEFERRDDGLYDAATGRKFLGVFAGMNRGFDPEAQRFIFNADTVKL